MSLLRKLLTQNGNVTKKLLFSISKPTTFDPYLQLEEGKTYQLIQTSIHNGGSYFSSDIQLVWWFSQNNSTTIIQWDKNTRTVTMKMFGQTIGTYKTPYSTYFYYEGLIITFKFYKDNSSSDYKFDYSIIINKEEKAKGSITLSSIFSGEVPYMINCSAGGRKTELYEISN